MKVTFDSSGENVSGQWWSDKGVVDAVCVKNGKPVQSVTLRGRLVARAYLGLVKRPKFDKPGVLVDVPTEGWAFELEKVNPETGQPWKVATDRLTQSTHKKSKLRPWWEALTGKDMQETAEAMGITEGMTTTPAQDDALFNQAVGCTALLTLERWTSQKGVTYVNIVGVTPLPEGMAPLGEQVAPVEDEIPF